MGLVVSYIKTNFPPKSKFSYDDIPDLSGQVIIVTGGSAGQFSGVGKQTVKVLLQHNAKVYIAARSEESAKVAIKDLRSQTGKEAYFLHLDLADLHSVKRAAEEFKQKETQLHVLFNNGGVMSAPIEQVTPQNIDLQFGTNVLGHFYLTKLLLPVLLATATPGKPARVINSSSFALEMTPGNTIHFNTLKDGPARKKLSPLNLYSQSKFGNLVFSNELARRYGDQGIMSVALHPGNIMTDLYRHAPTYQRKVMELSLYPVELGAQTQLWAGTTAEGANFNGKYLIPWARMGKANPKTLDPTLGKELWTWLEEQVADI
ncbi:NAD(P)-binding protein [Favolaschia claudopus]|uniref:NAD(P)-binding protein n=1 Tax=Favolaschia claudopus TaxID=2862362 RepID=A0AAW0CSG2_9AGAR